MIETNMTNNSLVYPNKKYFKKSLASLTIASVFSTSLFTSLNIYAQSNETTSLIDETSVEATKQDTSSSIEDAWDFADLYENTEGNYLKLSGRLQLDSAWVNSDQGDFNDTQWRRFRFGFKGKHDDLTFALEADINLNKSLDEAYNRLTDANINWAVTEDSDLKFLKQSAGFTMDGRTSSKKLLTPERNNLTNNLWFTSEYFTGVSLKSKVTDDLSYKAGIYSSDGSDEISISDASYFGMFSTTKKLAKTNLWDKGQINFDYVYNDTHVDGDTRDFSQIISASSKFTQDRWSLDSDISWGQGDFDQSDVFGVVVMPSYKQSETLQWVARYTYINSSEDNGVRLGRYEKNVVTDMGDKYQELYGGVNWYVNDHKLKFHAGIQYAKMEDNANDGGAYQGWGLTLAMRSYW